MSLSKTKYIHFQQQYDVEQLQSDLAIARQSSWQNHYVKDNYEGNWSLIPLISPGGVSNNGFAFQKDGAAPKPTETLLSCRYFNEVINAFPFPIVSARLMRLAAGSYIKPHTDHCLGYEDDSFRLHIPIVTNPQLEFILGGERLVMAAGSLWYINANYEHSVANKGETDRVHLVIDGERNDASDEMFYAMAAPEDLLTPKKQYSEEERAAIIEQMKAIGIEPSDDFFAS